MNQFHKMMPVRHLTIQLVIGVFIGFSACQSDEKADNQSDNQNEATATTDSTQKKPEGPVRVSLTQAQYEVAAIKLGQPSERSMQTTFKATGVLDVPAQNLMSVSVPFGGYIRRINLEPGMAIRKGQTLVILENPEYIQLQQDYLDTKAKLEYANLEFDRQQELSRDNVNALKVFQQVRSNRQSLQAQLAGMAQRLAIIRINPATLTPDRLTRTIAIPAPVSGFVTDVPVNNGRYVNPSDVLVQISDISHMHAKLSIFEKDISSIHTGQPVRFNVGADTSTSRYAHRGDIFLIGKSINPDRTIPVLVHPEGYSDDFIPGGYISAQIAVKTQPLSTLPEEAVVEYGGQSYIYVLEKRETKSGTAPVYQFRQVDVKTGVRDKGYIAVTIPAHIDPAKTPIVIKGAYSLLSKLNNSEEE
ncbi:efflux RND transporter periplasmic adaptor subunit [Spirosoma spitsbergense]|uniref:efflux RND transporter periplasmic adaptor subunit n=1 Tax=Spirosoma spitsbergense TaxID=431554 RepID=UPI0003696E03|nr:efflux RND transporter periplasmic adaptor subunit [Spirosoma spitsbergense]